MKFWNEADQRDHPAFVEAHSAGYSAGISTANATIRDLEADLSALKQRVAEVLEPFAEIGRAIPADMPSAHELYNYGRDELPMDVDDFRRAAELHAYLTRKVKS